MTTISMMMTMNDYDHEYDDDDDYDHEYDDDDD